MTLHYKLRHPLSRVLYWLVSKVDRSYYER